MSGKPEAPDGLDLSDYGENLAVMGSGTAYHVVDTRTFDNSTPVLDDGYTANVGTASALCGHEPVGRLLPAEGNVPSIAFVCGNCARSLRSL